MNLVEIAGSSRTFDDSDVRLLTLFAGQAASAVHNARLLAQAQERAARLAALHEIDLAITSAFDLTERLDLLLTHTLHQMRADISSVMLWNQITGDLKMLAQRGARHAEGWRDFHLKIGEGAAGWVAQHDQPLVIPDVQRDARWLRDADSDAEGIVAYLGVPLRIGDRVIGVLDLTTRVPRDFSPEQIEFMVTLASQAAVAIENARLFDETRRRLAELDAVNRISSAMRAAQTIDEMLPRILDETLAVLGTDAGIIRLYDATTGATRQAAARAWFTHITQVPLKRGEGIIGTVIATGKPYVSQEFVLDPIIRDYMRPQIPAGWGGAAVPIRTADEFIGVLLVAVPLPRELTESEVYLLTTIADIAGNAIHRTRLHEDLEAGYVETVLALARAMDARDSYTGTHSDNLAKLAVAVARALGMSRDEEETLGFAARLHDIGKIGVPDAILRKPGPLD
ncbi:MAG: GAF domain-containing protein, partial [Chloroflexi bacterium]|nr:GAF domain-containing protein [Chloroflexota bacterium]